MGLTVMVAVGLVLLFLLTQATTNRDLYERNYARLFAVNVVVAALLLLVIAWIAYRLIRRLVQKKFGSRLLVKLAAVFVLAGFAPGMLIYVVSYQFVTRSIESWFDVKVEGALDAGLESGPHHAGDFVCRSGGQDARRGSQSLGHARCQRGLAAGACARCHGRR